jgi:hypothetical protein
MPEDKQSVFKRFTQWCTIRLRANLNRGSAANLMMISFILFTTIGCFLVYVPAGFICAGVSCGLFGFLLGQE